MILRVVIGGCVDMVMSSAGFVCLAMHVLELPFQDFDCDGGGFEECGQRRVRTCDVGIENAPQGDTSRGGYSI